MKASLTYTERDASGPAVLRFSAPTSEDRTPAHFIGVVDVSESMLEGGKLVNVKHCLSLLLNFLTPNDEFSMISFGDEARSIVKSVKTDVTAKPMLESAINSLKTHGCTNLSAGLGLAREILEASRGSALKPTLLVLTDGHANRGESRVPELRAIVSRMRELYSSVSMAFIAYGTEHNADLLKVFVEDTGGSYSIVESLEGAALAMGNALGGAISCAAQNVVLELPAGSTVEGPYTITDSKITLGDVYAGAETLLLLNLPAGECTLRGMTMPLLDPFALPITDIRTDTARNVDVDLARLRFKCSSIFKGLRSQTLADLDAQIASFAQALEDPLLAGHPVTDMLKSELASIKSAVEEIRNHGISNRIYSQLVQHEVYTATTRGTVRPIRQVSFARSASPGDPGSPPPTARSAAPDFADEMSPAAPPQQQYIARAMRQRTTPAAPSP